MGFGGIIDTALNAIGGSPGATDSAGTFTIEQLSGEQRKVVLMGRALPYRPYSLPVTQRISTTWLPGFAEASVTVLGAKDETTTISGMWKDRFIQKPMGKGDALSIIGDARDALVAVSGALSGGYGEDPEFKAPILVGRKPVESVRDAAEIIDTIVREGQLVEVTWDVQRRRGFIVKFNPEWQNPHDLNWEMEFEWVSRGEKPVINPIPASTSSIVDEIEGIANELAGAVDELGAINDELDDLVTSQMQALVTLVDSIKDTISSVNQLINLPSASARRVAATLYSIISQSQDIISSFEQSPSVEQHRSAQRSDRFGGTQTRNDTQQMAITAILAAIASVTAVQTLDRAQAANKVKRIARRLMFAAANRRSQILRSLEEEYLAVHVAREGDNLREVARKIYGNANEWRRIMLFNKLTSTYLVAGQVIIIPRSTGEGTCASILP